MASFDDYGPMPNWAPTSDIQRNILRQELENETKLFDEAPTQERRDLHGTNVERITRTLQGKATDLPASDSPGGFAEDNADRLRLPGRRGFQADVRKSEPPASFEVFEPTMNWSKGFKKAAADAEQAGRDLTAVANIFTSLPAFITGTTAGVGAAAVGIAGGEAPREAYKSGLRIGEQVYGVADRLFNPIAVALKAFDSEKALDNTVANKAMGALTEAIKDYSRHVEKSTGNAIPAEGIEMLLNTAMIAYGGRARDIAIDRGLKNKQPQVEKAPTFEDFTPSVKDESAKFEAEMNKAEAADQARKDAFNERADARRQDVQYEKKQARQKKIDLAIGAGVGAAVGTGAGYAITQLRSPGNDILDEGEPKKTPEGTMFGSAADWVLDPKERESRLNQIGSLGIGLAALGAIKQKGGMWHPEAVTRLSEPLSDSLARGVGDAEAARAPAGTQLDVMTKAQEPIVAWAKDRVQKYLNKHAGTATDPLKDVEIPFVRGHAEEAGTAPWGEIMDRFITGKWFDPAHPEKTPGLREGEKMWGTGSGPHEYGAAISNYLSHAGDYAREHIPPEKLQQYDLVRLIKETAKWDAELAKKMNSAEGRMEGTTPYKIYPDGMQWVEVGNSVNPKLTTAQTREINAAALKREGDVMGHCVGGYCDYVESGEAKIYSLRDKKGMSHVTVEVRPPDPRSDSYAPHRFYYQHATEAFREARPAPTSDLNNAGIKWNRSIVQSPEYQAWMKEQPADIQQIKGKQNRAPNAEYLPYVQDFVKSGKWGEVGDLENAGLLDVEAGLRRGMNREHAAIRAKFPEERYITKDQYYEALKTDLPPSKYDPVQRGSADPRLLKALALAGVGVAVGASTFPDDRLAAGLVGGLVALGLGSGKVSEFPRLIRDNATTRSIERGIQATVEQFQRNVNPDLLGKQAESAASVLGRAYTEMMQRQLAIEIPSGKRAEFWFRQGASKGKAFLKAMERGSTFTSKTFNEYAIAYRTWMDKIFKQDAAMNIKYDPIDNYIYHAFEDPIGASAYFTKKYGIKWGDPSFTKDRTFSLIEEAEAAGFKLKTENPETLMVMRQHASDLAQLKVQALRDLHEFGLARKIAKGDTVGVGETLWRSPNGELYALGDQPNQIMHNAFNTKSLWADPGAGGQVFRALSYAKNAIVPIQLFGLFHPLHVQLGMSFADPLVAMTKRVAAGQASFMDFVKEALTKATLTDVVSTPKEGWRILKAFRGEVPYDKLSLADKRSLNLMTEGTFNPTMPVEYRNQHMRDLRNSIAEHSVKAAWHLPWAILEKFYTKPIFEQWIPAVKTAAYLRGAYAALEANPALLQAPLERMNALRKISKMVDDRFGEVQYKTLFMNRMVKDIAVASFLSYGWQLGFMRSYVGAVPESVSALRKGGLRERIVRGDLDKSLFVGYYVMGTMLYAGLLTYALTGEAPRDILDYIYPRTGQKNPDGSEARVGTPFYTREFVSVPKHMQEEGVLKGLGITVANKLSPAIGMLKAMVTNKDFFNREISNPNADAFTALGQKLKYAFSSMEPISVSGAQKGPPGVKTGVLSVMGFTPAPGYVTKTPMEAKIAHIYGVYHPSVTPYDRAERSKEIPELYKLQQLGQEDKFQDKLQELKEKYNLNNTQTKLLERNSKIPAPERMFRQLDAGQQAKLLKEMTPAERERFRPFAKKALRYDD